MASAHASKYPIISMFYNNIYIVKIAVFTVIRKSLPNGLVISYFYTILLHIYYVILYYYLHACTCTHTHTHIYKLMLIIFQIYYRLREHAPEATVSEKLDMTGCRERV